MSGSLSRRALMIGAPVLFGSVLVAHSITGASPIVAIETKHGGRLGVFAIDTGSGKTLAHRADERFLMCSTFKALLAAHVLKRIEARDEGLERMVAYGQNDLIFTSPTTEANVAKGALSVEDLLKAMMELSDNTAAVLLMRRSGGPKGLTAFLRSLDDDVTRSDRYEPASNSYSGDLDTTSPRAIITTVQKILLGDTLSGKSRGQLERWMIASKPGRNRIRAALPPQWPAGDRPGTSSDRQTNDFALVRPPGRAPLLVAAYYDAPQLDFDQREAVLREVGHAFVEWAT